MQQVRRKFLQDDRGNNSAKRLCGSILIAVGTLIAMFLTTIGLASGLVTEMTATSILSTLFLSGAGLLGVGVVEKFSRK